MPMNDSQLSFGDPYSFYEAITGRRTPPGEPVPTVKMVVGFEDADQNLLCRMELDPRGIDLRMFSDYEEFNNGYAIVAAYNRATTEVQLTGILKEVRYEDV